MKLRCVACIHDVRHNIFLKSSCHNVNTLNFSFPCLFFRKQSSMLPCRRRIVWTLSWSTTTWRHPSMTRYGIHPCRVQACIAKTYTQWWSMVNQVMINGKIYCILHYWWYRDYVSHAQCLINGCTISHVGICDPSLPINTLAACLSSSHVIMCCLIIFPLHAQNTCGINVMSSFLHPFCVCFPFLASLLAQPARVSHFTPAYLNTNTDPDGDSLMVDD